MPGTREDVSADALAFVRRGYALWSEGDLECSGQTVLRFEVESIRVFGDELVTKLLARTRGAASHLEEDRALAAADGGG